MPCGMPPSTPKNKQTTERTTRDSTDILPMGNYRDRGRELASSLKGQKHRRTVVLMRSRRCSPRVWSGDGLPCDTQFHYFYKSIRNIPHLIHFCLSAIRCSCVDNNFSSLLLIRWYHFICGCSSVFGSSGP